MTAVDAATAPAARAADPLRWRALGVIATCQLLVVLGASVVNIALPQLQAALGISDADRPWVVTAYTLGVGGLLLLGGRVADYLGRKRVLVAGLVGFAAASAIGGLAPDAAVLLAGRGLQGAFAAALTPAALSLLSVTFTDRRERATAFSVYGAMAGGGGAVGLVLGGLLTEYASWRWCLLVNVPVALVAAVLAYRWITESRNAGPAHYDIPGAVTVVLGLVALVYGFSTAARSGWISFQTLALLGAAVVLLASFAVIEARSGHPLLPPRIVLNRTRSGAFLAILLASIGLLTMFLFLTYYLQGTLHYSALEAGIAFLPVSVGTVGGTWATSRLLTRVGPRPLMITGMLASTAGLLALTRIGVSTSYWTTVLPAEFVVGAGIGLVFVTVASTALVGVDAEDTGVASAVVSTSQQIGGSLGTALLNTVAAAATSSFVAGNAAAALVHGYQVAFLVSACIAGAGTVVVVALVRTTTSSEKEKSS